MIIDTSRRTTSKLSSLAAHGVTAIIRYNARFTKITEKRLIRSEAEAILNAGMTVATKPGQEMKSSEKQTSLS
jgi:hypothetical protein